MNEDTNEELRNEIFIDCLTEYIAGETVLPPELMDKKETIKLLTASLYKKAEEDEYKCIQNMYYINYEFVCYFPFSQSIVAEIPYAIQAYLEKRWDDIKKLQEFYFLESNFDLTVKDRNMAISLYKKIFCFMVLSIQEGDEYTKSIIKQLYKIGFQKEYNQLKKFKKLTLKDIMEFYDLPSFENLARLIFMAHHIFQIDLEPATSYLMKSYQVYMEEKQECGYFYPSDFMNGNDSYVKQRKKANAKYINKMVTDAEEKETTPFPDYTRMLTLITVLFRHLDINLSVEKLIESMYDGIISKNLVVTLSAIDYAFEDETFDMYKTPMIKKPSEKEKEILSCVLEVAECSINREFAYNSITDTLLGKKEDEDEEETGSKFKKENLYDKTVKKEDFVKEVPYDLIMQPDAEKANDANAQKIIEELQEKYQKKIQELKYKNSLLEQKNAEIRKLKEKIELENNMHEELQVLREYMYHLTEDDFAVETSEDIIPFISAKKVVIIGGDSNWVKKLRNKYENWRFIKPNASSNISTAAISGADYVYFFTDCMKHGVYYRFMAFIRENRIPFGYIHQVNIEKNEKQVYDDLKKMEK